MDYWSNYIAELAGFDILSLEFNKKKYNYFYIANISGKFKEDFNEIFIDSKIVNNFVDKLEKTFKLTTTINTSNMVLFDPNGSIYKYNSVEDILKTYVSYRNQTYIDRKTNLLESMKVDINLLEIKIRFLVEVEVIMDILFNRLQMAVM